MARSNFQEGYQFLQLAHALAIGREELRMLLIVCSYALTELNQSIFGDDEHFRDIQVKIMLLQNSVKLAFKVIRIKSKGSQRSQRLTWTLDYAMMQEDETMTYKFMSFRRSNHSGKAYSKENGFCCIQ